MPLHFQRNTMFSRFLGKGGKAETPSEGDNVPSRGLEVIEDDPETVWGLWETAVAEQDSRLTPLPSVPAAPEPAAPPSSVPAAAAEPGFAAEADAPTQPMALADKSLAQRMEDALQTVEGHHPRIANTLRTLWGYPECSAYINKLIMNGGDGMGHARIGFNQEAVAAMMALSDLHEAQFGRSDSGGELGFADPAVRNGLGVR
jgi:hypothetical protein